MLRPQPLPDEATIGYLSDFQRVNGLENRNAAIRFAKRFLHGDGDLRLTAEEVAADIAGIDRTVFRLRHTHESFLTAFHGRYEGYIRDLRFCEYCRDEDLQAHGRPCLRRRHQLPGVYWCETHRFAQLREVSTEPDIWWADCQGVVVGHPFVAYKPNEQAFVRRYIRILQTLVDKRCHTPRQFKKVMLRICKQAGFTIYCARTPTVSEAFSKIAPRKWLRLIHPWLADDEEREFVVRRQGFADNRPHILALVAAGLFDENEIQEVFYGPLFEPNAGTMKILPEI